MKKKIVLLAVAAVLLAIAPAAQAAAITLVDTDSAHTDSTSNPNDFTLTAEGAGNRDGIYSYSYNAGASFDMLVVSVSREASADTFSVSYDGVDMDLATGAEKGSGVSIFYLATSAQSGTIALDYTGFGTVNGIGIGIAAIKSDDGPLGLIDGNYETGTSTSIAITPTEDGSFTMFAVDTNPKSYSENPFPALTDPLTQIDKVEDIGSNGFAAGYDLDVAAGSITYSYTNTNAPRGVAAANFAVGGGGFDFDPDPADGDPVTASVDPLALSWVNLPDCNNLSDTATVQVYWDTDEDGDNEAEVLTPDPGTPKTVNVTADQIGTYYWKIVATDPNFEGSGTPGVLETAIYSVIAETSNVKPTVEVPDFYTWLEDGTVTAIIDTAVITDDDTTLHTYTWSVVSGPGTVDFSPNGTNAAVDTDATFTAAGEYVLKLEVDDNGEHTIAGTCTVTVYADSCEAAKVEVPYSATSARKLGDTNYDCKVDFLDLAAMAANWLENVSE